MRRGRFGAGGTISRRSEFANQNAWASFRLQAERFIERQKKSMLRDVLRRLKTGIYANGAARFRRSPVVAIRPAPNTAPNPEPMRYLTLFSVQGC